MMKINHSQMKNIGYIRKENILNPNYECFAQIGNIETFINFNTLENTAEKECRDYSVPFTEKEIKVINTFFSDEEVSNE